MFGDEDSAHEEGFFAALRMTARINGNGENQRQRRESTAKADPSSLRRRTAVAGCARSG